MIHRTAAIAVLILSVFTLILTGCAPTGVSTGAGKDDSLAPVAALPKAMQDAPARVRTAYQFAVAQPDALRNVPCYCGCGGMGHDSNLACYVKEIKQGGEVVFDDHALGCSLCVDISQDVMRMTEEGQSPEAIRGEILANYSKFGPSNQ